MLGHSTLRKKRRNSKFTSSDYMKLIRTIREAPSELSNEDVMEEVTKTYGMPLSLITKPISFFDYAVQIIAIIAIVVLFIVTISYVSYTASNTDRGKALSPIEAPSSDVVF